MFFFFFYFLPLLVLFRIPGTKGSLMQQSHTSQINVKLWLILLDFHASIRQHWASRWKQGLNQKACRHWEQENPIVCVFSHLFHWIASWGTIRKKQRPLFRYFHHRIGMIILKSNKDVRKYTNLNEINTISVICAS